MKNALILHGADSHPDNNWFPWLKGELENKGYTVWIPALPHAQTPSLEDWLDVIFSNNEWDWNEETIIIGHSAGATLALRILEKLPLGIKINKAILVATFITKGTKPEYFHYKEGLLEKPFHWSKIHTTCKNFTFIASNNDKYQAGADQAKLLQQHLGGQFLLKPGQGHFNLEVNPTYKEFPLLLQII